MIKNCILVTGKIYSIKINFNFFIFRFMVKSYNNLADHTLDSKLHAKALET